MNEILSYDVSQDAVKENKYLNIEQIAGIHGFEDLCQPFFLSIESGVMLERQEASMSKQLRPVRDCVIIPSFPVLPRLGHPLAVRALCIPGAETLKQAASYGNA